MGSCPRKWPSRWSGEDYWGQILDGGQDKVFWWPRDVDQDKQSEGRENKIIINSNILDIFSTGLPHQRESQSSTEYKSWGWGGVCCIPTRLRVSEPGVEEISNSICWLAVQVSHTDLVHILAPPLGRMNFWASGDASVKWVQHLKIKGFWNCFLGEEKSWFFSINIY